MEYFQNYLGTLQIISKLKFLKIKWLKFECGMNTPLAEMHLALLGKDFGVANIICLVF